MKKLLLTTSLILITMFSNAQENTKPEKSNDIPKTQSIFKFKMGFSELKLYDVHKINGTLYQFDLMFSSRLSDKFRLEYGLGTSEFRGNHVIIDEYTDFKNQYIRVPANIVYTKDIHNIVSIISGLGFYGNYLYSSKLSDEISEKNVGFALGISFQYGVRFKINNESNITLSYEFQSDLTKTKRKELLVDQKLSGANLLSLNFTHKL